MSKLAQILNTDLYINKPINNQIVTSNSTWENYKDYKIYKVWTKIESVISVSDNESKSANIDLFYEATKQAKRRIIEEVFGEFRENIHAIYDCLYYRDFAKTFEQVKILENKMFTDL